MGEIRIHRGDPARFVKIPNQTAQGWLASCPSAALGYLTYALSQKPDWPGENAEDAAARMGVSVRSVLMSFRYLERGGFRHRVVRRLPGGEVTTELHYYDEPARPCPDVRTCKSCGGVSPGRTDPSDMGGR